MVNATSSTGVLALALGEHIRWSIVPLEAYFVHQLDDVALHGPYHRLAVVGLFYELWECNRPLDNFWSEFPEMKARIRIPGSHLKRILSISLTMLPFMARTTALL